MKVNKVIQMGNSWTVAIPKKYFLDLGINKGDYTKIFLRKDCIEVVPLSSRKREVEK